jgi:ABC-type sugar transport system permease subunit
MTALTARGVSAAPAPPTVTPAGRLTAVLVGHLVQAALWAVLFAGAANPSGFALSTLERNGLVFGGALMVVLHLLAALQVRRRRFSGRFLSLALNYLTCLAAAVAVLSRMEVFTGLDEFAGAWQDAFPAVVGLGVAGLWLYAATRVPERAAAAGQALRWAGLGLLALSAVAFVVMARVVQGVVELLSRLGDPVTLGLLVLAVVAGLLARTLWGGAAARAFGTTRQQAETLDGLLYLSPNLLGFLVFFAGPLLFSLVISFFDWDPLGEKSFTGFSNYGSLLALDVAGSGEGLRAGYQQVFGLPFSAAVVGAKDALFWISMKNIVVFMLLAVPLAVVPALFLAQLLNSKLPGVKVFRAIFFVPSVAGVIGISLIWKQLFNATVGFLNFFLGKVAGVLNVLPGVDLSTQPQTAWVSGSDTALLSVVIVFAWMTFGFNTVLFMAGLQGVPKELQEAAQLDGAGAWQRFRNVTLPVLRPTTFFVTVTTTILALQLFDIVFVLPAPNVPGSPNNATLTPVLYLYQRGFQQFDQGYAAAVAWILFAFIFAMTLYQFRRQQRAADSQ